MPRDEESNDSSERGIFLMKKENAFYMKKKRISQTLSILFVVSFLTFALAGPSFAHPADLANSVNFIKTPDALARLLTGNFRYELKMTDEWQTPEETLSLKKGDCDDFALLAQAVLKGIGIKSDVLILKFRGLSVLHAICIWKDKAGKYSFISNRELYRTGKSDIQEAVATFYPDIETISYADQDMHFTRTAKVIIGRSSP